MIPLINCFSHWSWLPASVLSNEETGDAVQLLLSCPWALLFLSGSSPLNELGIHSSCESYSRFLHCRCDVRVQLRFCVKACMTMRKEGWSDLRYQWLTHTQKSVILLLCCALSTLMTIDSASSLTLHCPAFSLLIQFKICWPGIYSQEPWADSLLAEHIKSICIIMMLPPETYEHKPGGVFLVNCFISGDLFVDALCACSRCSLAGLPFSLIIRLNCCLVSHHYYSGFLFGRGFDVTSRRQASILPT